MLPYPKRYRSIFKSSVSVKVREGPVKVTVKVTWHCSFLASAKICEGSVKISVKVKESSVTSEDCYWGSAVAFQSHKGHGRYSKKVTVIPWRIREGAVKQLPYSMARCDHTPQIGLSAQGQPCHSSKAVTERRVTGITMLKLEALKTGGP